MTSIPKLDNQSKQDSAALGDIPSLIQEAERRARDSFVPGYIVRALLSALSAEMLQALFVPYEYRE